MLGQSSSSPKRNFEDTQDQGIEHGAICSNKCLYESERQVVVNVSLSKLQSSPGHLKPSLRRFVLISSTLRHIKDELSSEGRVFDAETLEEIITTKLVPDESPFLEFFGATEVGRGCDNKICKLERGSFSDYVREPKVGRVGLFLPPQTDSFTDPLVSSLTSLLSSTGTCELQEALKPSLPPTSEQTTPLDIPDLDVEMFGDVDMSQYDYDRTDWNLPSSNPGSEWPLPSTNPNPKSPTQESVEDWLIKLQAENCISNFSSEAAAAGQVIC